ncbi:MAG: acyloxyacyl hydrolase [Bacteroidia bacterium]
MKQLFLLLFLINISFPLLAQFQNGLTIGADVHYGTLLKHTERQKFTAPDPSYGLSFEVMKQTFGRDYWAELHGYPRLGWGILYKSYGNPDTLGTMISIYPQLDLPVYRGKKLKIFTRMAYSVAYLNKPYNQETNPNNTAIGSRINNYTTVGMIAEYAITPKWWLRAGFNIAHSSNGRVSTPNLGLNTATARLGLSYQVAEANEKQHFPYDKYPLAKKPIFGFRAGAGLTETNTVNGPTYPIYVYSPFVIFPRSGKSRWFTGFEYSRNQLTSDWVVNQDIEPEKKEAKNLQMSVYGGHEFMFGRVGFQTQLQFYVHELPQSRYFWNAKIGPNVYLLRPHKSPRRNAYIGVYLKTEYFVAQYVDFTVGITL